MLSLGLVDASSKTLLKVVVISSCLLTAELEHSNMVNAFACEILCNLRDAKLGCC